MHGAVMPQNHADSGKHAHYITAECRYIRESCEGIRPINWELGEHECIDLAKPKGRVPYIYFHCIQVRRQ